MQLNDIKWGKVHRNNTKKHKKSTIRPPLTSLTHGDGGREKKKINGATRRSEKNIRKRRITIQNMTR